MTDQNLNQNLFIRQLAAFISLVFSPITALVSAFIAVLISNNLNNSQIINGMIILLVLGVIPCILVLYLLKKFGKISDWDIRKREERPLAFSILLIIGIVIMMVYEFLGLPGMGNFNLLILLLFLCQFLITLFWKISGHTLAVTISCLVIANIWPSQVWILLIIPAVIWSRVYRKNHTFNQAVAGVLLSLIIFKLGLWLKLI